MCRFSSRFLQCLCTLSIVIPSLCCALPLASSSHQNDDALMCEKECDTCTKFINGPTVKLIGQGVFFDAVNVEEARRLCYEHVVSTYSGAEPKGGCNGECPNTNQECIERKRVPDEDLDEIAPGVWLCASPEIHGDLTFAYIFCHCE